MRALTVLKWMLGLALLAAVIAAVDTAELFSITTRADWQFIMLGAVSFLSIQFVTSLRWQMCLLWLGSSIPLLRLFQLHFIAYSYGHFLPSELASDVFRYHDTRKNAASYEQAAMALLLTRWSGFVPPLLVVAVLGPAYTVEYTFVALALVAAPLGIAITVHKIIQRPTGRVFGLLHRLIVKPLEFASQRIAFAQLLSLILASFGAFGLMCLTNWAYARAIDLILVPAELVIVVSLVSVATLIPATPAAIGIKEGAFVVAFHLVGVDIESAVIVAVLNRTVSLAFVAIGMLMGAERLMRAKSRR